MSIKKWGVRQSDDVADIEPDKAPFTFYIDWDDRPKFVSYLLDKLNQNVKSSSVREDEEVEPKPKLFCSSRLLESVCFNTAVNCAKALLEGETGLLVDLNKPLDSIGTYPLHEAASTLNYDLVDLFLRYGARTDLTCSIEGLILRNGRLKLDLGTRKGRSLLPLDAALEFFENHIHLLNWTQNESIYKLVIILFLPEMKRPLETISLLALRTKEVKEVFNYYVKEGRLIQVAVLLMVAKECIMAPSTLESNDGSVIDGFMTICQSIVANMYLLAIEANNYAMNNGHRTKLVKLLQAKREALLRARVLLELFEIAGDAIETYRVSQPSNVSKESVARDVAAIIEEAGFFLEDDDIDLGDVDRMALYGSKNCQTGMASGILERIMADGYWERIGWILHPIVAKEFQDATEKPKRRMQPEHKKAAFPSSLLGLRSYPLAGHSFRNYSVSTSYNHTKAHFKGEANAIHTNIPRSRTSNLLGFLALSLKKGTRRV